MSAPHPPLLSPGEPHFSDRNVSPDAGLPFSGDCRSFEIWGDILSRRHCGVLEQLRLFNSAAPAACEGPSACRSAPGVFVTRAAMMRGRSFDDDSIFNITVVLPNLLVKIFLLNIYGA